MFGNKHLGLKFLFFKREMIATLVVALLTIGSAYCMALPPDTLQQISPEMNVAPFNGNTILIRRARQSDGSGK